MRRKPRAAVVAGLAAAALIVPAGAAHAQADTTPPAIDVAVLDPPASHQLNGWYRAAPVTMNLRATDDVAVAQFEYSTDSGATYTTVPVAPGSPVTTSVAIANEGLGNNSIRYRARDTSGNVSTVTSTAGRTASIRIDTRPPTATFAQIVDGRVGHAATLTPTRADAPTPPPARATPATSRCSTCGSTASSSIPSRSTRAPSPWACTRSSSSSAIPPATRSSSRRRSWSRPRSPTSTRC